MLEWIGSAGFTRLSLHVLLDLDKCIGSAWTRRVKVGNPGKSGAFGYKLAATLML